jgi:predicted DNA-binding transcriptional regulator AlpA
MMDGTVPLVVLRVREAARRAGYSVSHIYQLEAKGEFIQRVRLGENKIGYFEHELNQWLLSKARGTKCRIPTSTQNRMKAKKPRARL